MNSDMLEQGLTVQNKSKFVREKIVVKGVKR